RAHELRCDPLETRQASLDELTAAVVNESQSSSSSIKWPLQKPESPPPLAARHAVNRALLRYDFEFFLLDHGANRGMMRYQIRPRRIVAGFYSLRAQVRLYRENLISIAQGQLLRKTSTLHKFVSKARRLIDKSRKHRDPMYEAGA